MSDTEAEAWVRGNTPRQNSPCGGCPSAAVTAELKTLFATIDRLLKAGEITKAPSYKSIHRRLVALFKKDAPKETKLRRHIHECLKR